MKILDRQRYLAFFKAYLVSFVSLVGLVIVIDAFANLDEFTELDPDMGELFRKMGRYYLVRLSMYYDLLASVIGMMAAVFAATWMQKNNELIAMLAAGISTKRVIRPILVSAFLCNALAIGNQEFLMPGVAEELQQPPDHFEGRKLTVYSREDQNGITISAEGRGHAETLTVTKFHAALPLPLTGVGGWLHALEGTYIPPDHPTAPLVGGWLLRRAQLAPPDANFDERWLVELEDPDAFEGFPPSTDGLMDLGERTFFLKTNVSFQAITRDPRQWFRYASTPELIRALGDSANAPEALDIAVYLHNRLMRPLLGMGLLFLTMPIVLGGERRNMFINMGLSLGTSAFFYGTLYIFQYLGTSGVIAPEAASWAPMILVGTIAAARWDSIRT